jgi:ribosomal protein S18 acetylase RimI-like enzyme
MISNTVLETFYKLNPEDVKRTCEMLGRAFYDDPVSKFVYPDEEERKEKLQYGFYMLYQYGIRHCVTYAISDDLEGTVTWSPPDKIYPSFWEMMRYGGFYSMRKAGLKMKSFRRSMAVFTYEEKMHKQLVPYKHWYLQNLAVDPEQQRKGYGAKLLGAMIPKIDAIGLPIYLETNKERNLSFYRKFGFEIIEHVIIPKTDVPLWCMLRKPENL